MAEKEELTLSRRRMSTARALACAVLTLAATIPGRPVSLLADDRSELQLLSELRITCARISPLRDQAVIDIEGRLRLPRAHATLAPDAIVNLYIAERLVLDARMRLDRDANAWTSRTPGMVLTLSWLCERTATFELRGEFDPHEFALNLAEETGRITFVLALGRPPLTGEADVFSGDWRREGAVTWARCEPDPN